MIEVFKTDVTIAEEALLLVRQLNLQLGYTANFDLQDCDHILRVVHSSGSVEPKMVIRVLEQEGFRAEILPDVVHRPVERTR